MRLYVHNYTPGCRADEKAAFKMLGMDFSDDAAAAAVLKAAALSGPAAVEQEYIFIYHCVSPSICCNQIYPFNDSLLRKDKHT